MKKQPAAIRRFGKQTGGRDVPPFPEIRRDEPPIPNPQPDPTSARTSGGQFAKGSSGNPAGRPPGSRNQVTLMMETFLDSQADDLIGRVFEMAVGGNVGALRLCLERLFPPRRDRHVAFDLPPLDSMEQISKALAAIMKAISEGKLTTAEGEAIVRIVETKAKLIASVDLERRVITLETARAKEEKEIEEWRKRF